MQNKRSVFKKWVSWLTLIAFSVFSVMPASGYASVIQTVGEDGRIIFTTSADTVWEVGNFDQAVGAIWDFNLTGGNLQVNVTGGDRTTWSGTTNIFGGLLGLFNPNGIHFTETSRINLTNAGFIGAAMRAVDGMNFNNLKLEGSGYLLNEGQMQGGNIALLGGAVENRGTIEAPLNQITIAGGKAMTVGLSGDNLISVVVDEATDTHVNDFSGNSLSDQIKNSGNLTANKIRLDAKGIDSVFEKAINLTGEVRAVDVDFNEWGELVMMSLDDIYSKAVLEASRIFIRAGEGDIDMLGVTRAKELDEKGASFQIGGTFEVENSWHDNLDNAITYAVDTNVSGTINDIANIVINGGVTVTMTGDTIFNSDSDTNGTGAFLNSGIVAGGNNNLTIRASEASTLGTINNVNSLTIDESQGSSNPTYSGNAALSVSTLNMNSGTFDLSAGLTATTALNIASGAILDLNGSSLVMTGATFSNLGTLRLQGGEALTNFTNDTDSGTVIYDGAGTYASLAAGDSYYNLTLEGLGGSFGITNPLDVNNDFTITAVTFSQGANQINVGGDFSYSNNGSFSAGGAFVFDGTGTQTVDSGAAPANVSFGDLTKSGSGVLQFVNDFSVMALTISNGTTVDLNGQDGFINDLFNNGTLRLRGDETVTLMGGMDTNSGTVEYNGTGSYLTALALGNNYYNLTFSGNGGTWEPDGAVDVDGALTIGVGATFDIDGQNLDLTGGTFSNLGTLRLQGGETLTNFTNDTDSGTVVYDGSGPYVSLAAGDSYYNLTFNNATTGNWMLDAGLDVDGNLTITDGALIDNGQIINLAGNWTNLGDYDGTGTVVFDGAGTQTLISGGPGVGQDFANIVMSGATLQLSTNEVWITNNLTIVDGIVDLNGQNLTLGGTFSNDSDGDGNGTLALQGGETLTGFINDVDSGTISYGATAGSFADLAAGHDYYNLSFQSGLASVTYAATADVDVNNDIYIGDATFNVGANTVNVGGDWDTVGIFTSTGTVIFDGGNQSITGNTTFHNFTKVNDLNNSTDETLTFGAGSTTTVNGAFTITGIDDDDRVNLVSSNPGSQWNLNLQGTSSIDWADVTDSDASAGNAPSYTNTIFSGGNNTSWVSIFTWSGATSTVFSLAANWVGGVAPTSGDDVVIADVANDPLLDAGFTFGDLTINSSAILDLNGFDITVGGVFVNSGTLRLQGVETLTTFTNDVANGGSVVYYGNGLGTDYLSLAAGNSYYNLLFDNVADSWAANATLNISNDFIITNGEFDNSSNRDINIGGAFTNAGTYTTGTETVTFNGAGTQTLTSNSSSIYNVTHSGSGTLQLADDLAVTNTLRNDAGNMNFNGQGVTVGNDFFVTNGAVVMGAGSTNITGDLSISGGTITGPTALGDLTAGLYFQTAGIFNAGDGDITINGATFIQGTADFNGAAGALDFNGNVTQSDATSAFDLSSTTTNVSGNFTLNDGTFNHNNGELIFDGTTALTSGGETFNDVTIGTNAASGSVTLLDATDINGTLSFNTSFGTAALNSTNQIVNYAGATIDLTNADTFTTTGSTWIFDGAIAQAITTAGNIFNNIILDNANGTFNILSNGITIGGALILNRSASITATNQNVTVTGNTDSEASEANSLTLNSGTTGTILMTGAVGSALNGELGTLTVAQSNGTTFSSTVNATTVTLTDTADGSDITFNGALTVVTLNTAAQGYDLVLNGGATITNDVITLNTGTVTLGNDAGDTTTFNGGLDTTAASSTNVAGTVQTSNDQIDLGVTNVTANTSLISGTGALNVGAVTIADGATLTMNDGSAGAIAVTSVTGTAGGAASNLTINTASTASVGAIGTDIGNFTNISGATTLGGTMNLGGNFSIASGSVDANGNDINVGGLTTITNSTYTGSTGTSTFTGGLDLTAATMTTSGAGSIVLGNNVTTNASATTSTISGNLDLGGAVRIFNVSDGAAAMDLEIAAAMTNGGFTKSGEGTVVLTGTNSYEGTTTISAGTLQIGSGGTTGTLGSGAVVDNAALIINRSDAITIANDISGTGTLTQAGTGTTTLTGTNSYEGTTTISAGTLQIGSGGTAGTLGSGALVGNAALIINRSDAVTIANDISGTGTLTQAGTGTTTLTGDNTYDGLTTVSAGVLRAESNTALGSAVGGTVVEAGAALELAGGVTINNEAITINGTGISNGGALRSVSGNNTLSGTVTLGSDATIGVDANQLTLSGVVSSVAHTLTKVGAGILSFGNAVNLGGNLVVNAGTITGTGDITVSGGNVTGNGVINMTGGTFTLEGTGSFGGNSDWTFNDLVFDLVGTTTKTGSGNIVVTDDLTINVGHIFNAGANTYTIGGDWLNAGTFNAQTSTVILNGAGAQSLTSGGDSFNDLSHTGSGTVTLQDDLDVDGNLVNSAGIFDANGNAVTVDGLTTVSGGNYVAGTGTQTHEGGLTVSGGTYTGSTGDIDVNGNVTLSSGALVGTTGEFTVEGNWNQTGGTFDHNNGTVTFDRATGTQTLNSLNEFSHLIHSGAGTLQLTGDLDVDGNLVNSAGTFDANGNAVTVGGLTTVSGGEYIAGTGTQTHDGGLTISGGTYTGATDGTTNVGDDLTISSGMLNANGSVVTVDGATTVSGGTYLTGNGTQTLNNGLNINGGTVTGGTGVIDVNGNVGLSNNGVLNGNNAKVQLSGDWTNTGGTFNYGTSTVNLDGNGAQSLTTGGGSFYNLTHSGAGTMNLQDDVVVTNQFTNAGGGVNHNGNQLTIPVVVTPPTTPTTPVVPPAGGGNTPINPPTGGNNPGTGTGPGTPGNPSNPPVIELPPEFGGGGNPNPPGGNPGLGTPGNPPVGGRADEVKKVLGEAVFGKERRGIGAEMSGNREGFFSMMLRMIERFYLHQDMGRGVYQYQVNIEDVFADYDRGLDEFRKAIFEAKAKKLSERLVEKEVKPYLTLSKIEGEVKVVAADGTIYDAEVNLGLQKGDQIWTGKGAKVEVVTESGGDAITVEQDSAVKLEENLQGSLEEKSKDLLTLAFGKMSLAVSNYQGSNFAVQTPTQLAGNRG